MKLSILTTVRDTALADLRLCLTSCLQQQAVDLELIVIADNATPEVLSLLEEFESDSRVRVLRFFNKEPMGTGMAINHALLFARGEYIGIVESCSFLDTNFYLALLHSAEATQMPVIKGNCVLRKNGVAVKPLDICESVANDPFAFSWQYWTGLYKRDFLQENGMGLFPYVSTHEGTLFLAKIGAYVGSIPAVPSVYYNHCEADTGSPKLFTETNMIDIARVRAKAAQFLLMMRENVAPADLIRYIGYECLTRLVIEATRSDSNKAYEAAARGFCNIVSLQDGFNIAAHSLKILSSQFPDFDIREVRNYSYVLEYMKGKPLQSD